MSDHTDDGFPRERYEGPMASAAKRPLWAVIIHPAFLYGFVVGGCRAYAAAGALAAVAWGLDLLPFPGWFVAVMTTCGAFSLGLLIGRWGRL